MIISMNSESLQSDKKGLKTLSEIKGDKDDAYAQEMYRLKNAKSNCMMKDNQMKCRDEEAIKNY